MFKRIPDCAIIYNWDVSNTYKHRPMLTKALTSSPFSSPAAPSTDVSITAATRTHLDKAL
jgi:hypothetical protein